MLPVATKSLIRSSWKQAKLDRHSLSKGFYDRLFTLAPGVRSLFPEDLREQRQKLVQMLDAVVFKLDDLNSVISELTRLGERHNEYGAEESHYPVVGQALLGALKDQLGDSWNDDIESAWEEAYAIFAAVMIEAQRTVAV